MAGEAKAGDDGRSKKMSFYKGSKNEEWVRTDDVGGR